MGVSAGSVVGTGTIVLVGAGVMRTVEVGVWEGFICLGSVTGVAGAAVWVGAVGSGEVEGVDGVPQAVARIPTHIQPQSSQPLLCVAGFRRRGF